MDSDAKTILYDATARLLRQPVCVMYMTSSPTWLMINPCPFSRDLTFQWLPNNHSEESSVWWTTFRGMGSKIWGLWCIKCPSRNLDLQVRWCQITDVWKLLWRDYQRVNQSQNQGVPESFRVLRQRIATLVHARRWSWSELCTSMKGKTMMIHVDDLEKEWKSSQRSKSSLLMLKNQKIISKMIVLRETTFARMPDNKIQTQGGGRKFLLPT